MKNECLLFPLPLGFAAAGANPVSAASGCMELMQLSHMTPLSQEGKQVSEKQTKVWLARGP